MMLRRAAVSSALVAAPLALFTVYADGDEADAKPSRRINISQLPLYGDPTVAELEFIPEKETAFRKNVSLFRQEVWKFMDKYKETQETVMQKYEVSKAHTNDLLQYIQDDAGVLPRAAIITVAGLGGIVAGYKGGFIRRTFFGGVAMTTAASICYPHQAVDIARTGWGQVSGHATDLWKPNTQKEEAAPAAASEPAQEEKDDAVKTAEPAANQKVDASKLDHGMSKAEDKDMYTTRSS